MGRSRAETSEFVDGKGRVVRPFFNWRHCSVVAVYLVSRILGVIPVKNQFTQWEEGVEERRRKKKIKKNTFSILTTV